MDRRIEITGLTEEDVKQHLEDCLIDDILEIKTDVLEQMRLTNRFRKAFSD